MCIRDRDDRNQILGKFKEQFPEASVGLACEEDVTDDGCKDLIVIYTEKELTRTVAVIDSGDGVNYNFTTPIPGPIENQKIQFKNIDKEGEIEIIVTGEKKGAVGYACLLYTSGAYKNKTMNLMFLYPLNRKKIMAAKMLAVCIFCFAGIVIAKLACYGVSNLGFMMGQKASFPMDYNMLSVSFYIPVSYTHLL